MQKVFEAAEKIPKQIFLLFYYWRMFRGSWFCCFVVPRINRKAEMGSFIDLYNFFSVTWQHFLISRSSNVKYRLRSWKVWFEPFIISNDVWRQKFIGGVDDVTNGILYDFPISYASTCEAICFWRELHNGLLTYTV